MTRRLVIDEYDESEKIENEDYKYRVLYDGYSIRTNNIDVVKDWHEKYLAGNKPAEAK